MFEDMVVSSPHPLKTNKPWTVVVSMIAQTIFLAILIVGYIWVWGKGALEWV